MAKLPFEKRLDDYRKMKGPAGSMSSKENLRYWQERASENSDTHLHRAKSGPIELPVVGIGPAVTKEAGGTSGQGRLDHAHEMARKDRNHHGSGYMRHVRRTTGWSMVTRRRYKRGSSVSITVDEPVAEPGPTASADVSPPPAPPPPQSRKGPDLPQSDPADHDAIKRAVEAARLADEFSAIRSG